MAGKVFLVGAGPGDPGLLTRKAERLLREADVVVLDALVSAEIVAMIRPGARIVNAGKRATEPVKMHWRMNSELVGMKFKVIHNRQHSREDSHKEPGNFLDRTPAEIVRLVNLPRR